jgi:acetolactate synthase-1/2/3 large subunit
MDQPAAAALGGQVFVDSLVAGGVEFFSCVPGESFLPVLDALYGLTADGRETSVRLVTARHESAAGFMAEAAGKLTGRPAVCLVTRGPGAMHAAIAVHTAYQDGTPLILAVGQIARAHRGREAFQEMDYRSIFSSTAKLVVEIDDVDRIPEIVGRALHVATAGRPGPVVIALPEDVLYALTSATPVRSARTFTAAPSSASVREIVEVTASARRPLVIVGGSTWTEQAGRDILRFAGSHGVPVVSTFRSQDVVDNRSDSYIGYLGLGGSEQLRRHAAEADAWIVLGARLDDPTTDGYALIDDGRQDRTIVVTGEDAMQASQTFMPDVSVVCSIEPLARELATVSAEPTDDRVRRVVDLRREHLAFVAVDQAGELARIVRHIRDELPDDAVITNGAGNYTGWVQRYFEFRRARTQIAPHNGAMAYGLPAAIAAAAIRPGVPVVAFAGDGCFMMSGNEIATAVQHDLELTVVVVNNAMYGTIRMHQENQFPGRTIATELRNPDFVRYAESFGAGGWSVDSAAGFVDAFAGARRRGGVNLIEVVTDPDQITTGARLPITASRKGRS